MFIAALFIITQNWKQPRCPQISEWINNCYIHTMGYYSAIKIKELTTQKDKEETYMHIAH